VRFDFNGDFDDNGRLMRRLAILLIVLGGCDRILGLDEVRPPLDGPPPGVWQEVAAGDHFTCAVTTSNALYCWGYNGNGQLGASLDEAQVEAPTLVSGAWSSVAVGEQHACAIRTDGSLWCWGRDFANQLGNSLGGNPPANAPTVADAVPRTQWASVATFDNHTCAIASDQTLWCWGSNTAGQADPSTTGASAAPTQIDVAGSPAWQAVSTGVVHTCAVTVDHALWCWGADYSGQSGVASMVSIVPPTQVAGNYVAVSTGVDFTCAIDTDTHVQCWGTNHVGQLGRGGVGGSQAGPAIVAGNGTYEAISAGWSTACGLTTAQSVECWGDLTGTTSPATIPTALGSSQSRMLSTGRTHLCAIDTTGALSCAGDNTAGQLGQPAPDTTVPQMIISSGVTEVALGDQFGCAIAGAKLFCWGDNSGGELASGDYLRHLTPSVVAGFALTKLALGGDHACGIDAGEHAYCWGNNPYGGLGNGTIIGTEQPVQLSLQTVTMIGLGDQHTCATANGANGWCWGRGLEGQLATGATASSSVPTVMSQTLGPISKLAGGFEFTCWIETLKVYCAGKNDVHQLANGDINAFPRVSVGAGSFTNVYALAAGREHVCALSGTSTGKDIYCWGRNYEGELGNGTTTTSSAIPTQISSIGTYVSVVSGEHHSCGLTTTGTVTCWGQNDRGQLGDGTRVERVSPVAVTTNGSTPIAGVTAIAAGGSTTCALIGGALECWGDNGFGGLGLTTGWLNDFTPVAVP
jgi:alpha-tubulin suppressor-like RCC1 family protein